MLLIRMINEKRSLDQFHIFLSFTKYILAWNKFLNVKSTMNVKFSVYVFSAEYYVI